MASSALPSPLTSTTVWSPVAENWIGTVMGNPLNALSWLADKLATVGTPLRRGMIVMTGSIQW